VKPKSRQWSYFFPSCRVIGHMDLVYLYCFCYVVCASCRILLSFIQAVVGKLIFFIQLFFYRTETRSFSWSILLLYEVITADSCNYMGDLNSDEWAVLKHNLTQFEDVECIHLTHNRVLRNGERGGEFFYHMSSSQLLIKNLPTGVSDCYLAVFCSYLTLYSDYVCNSEK
jgi:hypothetical protein